ncbi:MAG: hypothetical protein A2W05_04195 [Candidatus Schekmanbacteria bacterium RBG_16_38_10]|uniref:Cobalamin biosynthesis protein CbiX n=1 Tax=Candidatus Schekmanbacteria bacterium RBG_16_38_10 TaxID=1817879 RepID=A0A1F7RYH7_9BACT|nr:MAG: hypothetical protein A2W05_04195 [Candidatus Schekmanbacteria bacterium RBG_16_38_10]
MFKKNINLILLLLVIGVFATFLINLSYSFAGEEENKHDMSTMKNEPAPAQGEAQGMPGMAHDAGEHAKHSGHSWEDMKKWPGMENKTKEELDAMMMMMPPDHEVYISSKDLKKDVGVIVIAHGGTKVWNESLAKSLDKISSTFPTTIAFGMAMGNSKHIQEGINHLEEAGAKKIVVVMAFFNENNEVTDQIKYIFGLADKALWPPVDRVKSKAKIEFAPYMDDNPFLAEILTDHAKSISSNPKKETVIIIGHGPVNPDYNKKSLEIMDKIAKEVKASGGFNDVKAWNLQDDAPKEVRNVNVKKIRGMMEEAIKAGNQVLVVGMLISSRGIQHKMKTDFKGVDYKFNEQGVVTHENFGLWVGEAVKKVILKDE